MSEPRKRTQVRLDAETAKQLGLEPRDISSGGNAKYTLNNWQRQKLKELKKQGVSTTNDTKPNDYKDEPFILSAYDKETNSILSVQEFCKKYNLPADSITSFKFLPHHYKHPTYHIVFKEQIVDEIKDFDFESLVKKWSTPINITPKKVPFAYDFDAITYTDVHIGMETDSDGSAMYAEPWNKDEVMKLAHRIVTEALDYKRSNTLTIDDLGDLADGLDGQTTRGGHNLPQNMTNEEVFDCAFDFNMYILDGLAPHYEKVIINKVCNDNHSGVFSYFINKMFKNMAEHRYNHVEVNLHRTFFSHYIVGDIAFVISHGKDKVNKKFGMKVKPDPQTIETVDQYIKRMGLYGKCKRIIFKKGDSHQALYDFCSSDDFDYFNYPAASPSSQYIQDNYKKGRKGFVLERFEGVQGEMKPFFY